MLAPSSERMVVASRGARRSQSLLAGTGRNGETIAACCALAIWCISLASFGFGLNKAGYDFAVYVGGLLVNVGMFALLFATFTIAPHRRFFFREGTLLLYGMIIFWGCVIAFNGFEMSFRHIRDSWGIPNSAWAYLMPMVMLLGGSPAVWRSVMQQVCLMGWVLVPAMVVGALIGFRSHYGLADIAPHMLLFWHYLPVKRRKSILWTSLIALFFATVNSTRTSAAVICLLVGCGAYIEFFRKHRYRSKRRLFILAAFTLILGAVMYIGIAKRIPGGGNWVNSRLEEFFGEFGENTRTNEHHNLYLDFLQDISPKDLILGRGCMGTYAVEWGSYDKGRAMKDRTDVECGYLQMILKGGIVVLVVNLILAIPAVILGFFNANNLLVRGCAFIVLIRLVEMFPFGLPSARAEYLVFWLAVGCCWSPVMRQLSEKQLCKSISRPVQNNRLRGGPV